MLHVIVDGANVVGSRPDGWWRDRPGAARRLAGQLVAALVTDPAVLVAALGRDPASGVPAPGVPAPGVPAPGVPAPGVPAPGVPTPGVPTPGVPTPGVPTSGGPASAVTVHLVLEGAAARVQDLPTHPDLEVVAAPADGDAAVAALAADLQGNDVLVVTADRGLRERVHATGAGTVGPGALLGALPAVDG